MTTEIDQLTDVAVMSVLQQLTEDLRDALPADDRTAISSAEEARLALAHLLDQHYTDELADRFAHNQAALATAGRQLLSAAAADAVTEPAVSSVVADPPSDDQMSLAAGLDAVIVLGALVTLLQTRVKIRVQRQNGKVEFEFEVDKAATDSSLVRSILEIARRLFGRS